MPQLAVAAVGAYVGSTLVTGTVLGLSGAAWGWIVGSTLGGMLFGPKPEDGPRITDGKFASGAYGQNIPISYGTIRHKAQVVWFSGLHEHKDEVGGNSISDGADVYSYTCDLLVSACEGPQGAVLRIWANGRLIWTADALNGTADEEIIKATNVRVYLGDEDQSPDPLYEADVGTENAAAYRGQVTVMLEGIQLAFAGNRPPVIEVEVTEGAVVAECPIGPIKATDVTQTGLFLGSAGLSSHGSDGAAFDAANMLYYVATSGPSNTNKLLEAYDVSGDYPALASTVPLSGWNFSADLGFAGFGYDPENALVRLAGSWNAPLYTTVTSNIEYVYDGAILEASAAGFCNTFGQLWGNYPVDGQYGGTGGLYGRLYSIYPSAGAGKAGEAGWWTQSSALINYRLARLVNGDQGGATKYGWHLQDEIRYNEMSDVVYVPYRSGIYGGGGFNVAWRWSEWKAFYDDEGTITVIDGADGSDTSHRGVYLVYAPRRKKVYAVTDSYGIASIDVSSSGDPTTIHQSLVAYPAEVPVVRFAVWSEQANALVVGHLNEVFATLTLWLIDPDTLEVLLGPCLYDTDATSITAPKDLGDGRFVCLLGGLEQVAIIAWPGSSNVSGTPTTLRAIVEDVCERSGLPAENLDATAGTDLVDGYKIATQSTARAAIDNLRPGYFFDMPESGLQLVLKKRGGAAVATIDSGELGAHLFQATQTDPTPPYELEHVQEIEVPRTVEVVYIDAAQDYDQGVQRASRQVGSSLAPLRIDVPVSLSVDKAQQVAWVNLLLAHASKSTVSLALPHSYMALDAADPINVPLSGGETQRIRIERVTRARPMLEVEAVLEDAEIYDQTMTGGAPAQGPMQGTPTALSDTVLALIDTSPLRDEDDALTVYAAMGRDVRAEAWPGGVAYKSVDGGSNWDALYSTASSATIGQTIGGLANFTGGNVWDDDSSVSIVLSSGTLSSATDAGVLAGMNALAIQSGSDWEIVQFVNAELTATNTWRVSRLLRGRKGTERAISGHAPLDRVVLLTASSLRLLSYALGEVGLQRDFLAVTSGQALADGVQQQRTMNGNTIRPLAPVHIAGTRDAGDLTITWIRRARLNAEWRDLYDVPIDEPTESYEIDILDGAAVVRTLTASTTTVEYTAAQQTTDFGSPQASVDVAIYQISSRIGRGHAGTATL